MNREIVWQRLLCFRHGYFLDEETVKENASCHEYTFKNQVRCILEASRGMKQCMATFHAFVNSKESPTESYGNLREDSVFHQQLKDQIDKIIDIRAYKKRTQLQMEEWIRKGADPKYTLEVSKANDVSKTRTFSPLAILTWRNVEIIKMVLSRGVDPNEPIGGSVYDYPIFYAVKSKAIDTLKVLVQEGARIDRLSLRDGSSLLEYVLTHSNPNNNHDSIPDLDIAQYIYRLSKTPSLTHATQKALVHYLMVHGDHLIQFRTFLLQENPSVDVFAQDVDFIDKYICYLTEKNPHWWKILES
jgi:hypothetical protein